MPVIRSRARPTALEAKRDGCYLTDGTVLYRVAHGGGKDSVLLENCRWPKLALAEWKVSEVCKQLRLVRPL